MATAATNKAAAEFLTDWLAGKTIHCLLLSGNTTSWQTAATARDFNFAQDITADEPSGWTNYARQTVTGGAVSEDDANDRGEVDFDDITFASLDSSGATVDGVAFIVDVTDDTDSYIIGIVDVTGEATVDRTPDGNNFVVQIGTEGLVHLLTT